MYYRNFIVILCPDTPKQCFEDEVGKVIFLCSTQSARQKTTRKYHNNFVHEKLKNYLITDVTVFVVTKNPL